MHFFFFFKWRAIHNGTSTGLNPSNLFTSSSFFVCVKKRNEMKNNMNKYEMGLILSNWRIDNDDLWIDFFEFQQNMKIQKLNNKIIGKFFVKMNQFHQFNQLIEKNMWWWILFFFLPTREMIVDLKMLGWSKPIVLEQRILTPPCSFFQFLLYTLNPLLMIVKLF